MAAKSSPVLIKVTLRGMRPPIWRRLVVAGEASLADLHLVLQVAMGWEDAHLHAYRIAGVRYGPADDAFAEEVDESSVSVADTLGARSRGEYDYDFGDSWEHDLVVEKPKGPLVLNGVATCTAGKRACPPEDCGGVWGYAGLLEALRDPRHEEHEDSLEWLGAVSDPEAFDPAAVNSRLERVAFGAEKG
ncbi:MAG: plasmid pRiA4b ORF-3 family protein [Acidimicrobiales bacterium]